MPPRLGWHEITTPQAPSGGFRGRLGGGIGLRRARGRQRPALGYQPDVELVLSEAGQIADRKLGPFGVAAARVTGYPVRMDAVDRRPASWKRAPSS